MVDDFVIVLSMATSYGGSISTSPAVEGSASSNILLRFFLACVAAADEVDDEEVVLVVVVDVALVTVLSIST